MSEKQKELTREEQLSLWKKYTPFELTWKSYKEYTLGVSLVDNNLSFKNITDGKQLTTDEMSQGTLVGYESIFEEEWEDMVITTTALCKGWEKEENSK